MKEFDLKELSACDGRKGRRTCIAHGDRVIDVSESDLWKGGLHMQRHHAGNDLTSDIKLAPHGLEVLERYPQVGILKKEDSPEIKVPKALAWLLDRYPILKRHPHPMTVHFPIVFMFAVPLFNVLYLITGFKSFEITALHCLGAGILFTPRFCGNGADDVVAQLFRKADDSGNDKTVGFRPFGGCSDRSLCVANLGPRYIRHFWIRQRHLLLPGTLIVHARDDYRLVWCVLDLSRRGEGAKNALGLFPGHA